MSVEKLIMAYLPDFCWQTAFEVMTMLECASDSESIRFMNVINALRRLEFKGLVVSRPPSFPAGYRVVSGFRAMSEFRKP